MDNDRSDCRPSVTESHNQRAPGSARKATSICPGCGVDLPAANSPTHAYMGASPACWARYGELLAREYENPALFAAVHQLTVDAYAVQHPGVPERRTIQSVALHLSTLCLVLERGADPSKGPKLHELIVERPIWHWLAPPEPNGTLTVLDVLSTRSPGEHEAAVRAWAEDIWRAWASHHATVRCWLDQSIDA